MNPDAINGVNIYNYCNNNPIMMVDPERNLSTAVIGLLIRLGVGIVAGTGYAMYEDYYDNLSIDGSIGWKRYLKDASIGGIAGAILGATAGKAWPYISTLFSSIGTNTIASTFGSVSALSFESATTTAIVSASALLAGLQVMSVLIGKSNGYRIEHHYPNDHSPAHVHVSGDRIKGSIRVGVDGNPLPNESQLPNAAKKAIEKLIKKIIEALLPWMEI